jgi:hypothetical protein
MHAQHLVKPLVENANAITYSSGAATVLFWGLHLSDIAVLLSSFASVCGVGLQFYVALHRIRRLEKGLEANNKVTEAQAVQARAIATKLETK